MSKSSPRSSNTALPVPPRLPDDDPEIPASAPAARPIKRRFQIRIAAIARWLHIYLSLFGLAATLFFSATGLTLNHPDWFFANTERRESRNGMIEPSWVRHSTVESQPDRESSSDVAKLEIVEQMRAQERVRGALADFRVDELECTLTFKGPAYAADVLIDRETGSYQLTETTFGLVALLNDLHKGRDSGPTWSIVIDVAAILLVLISLTGLILILYLKLRRRSGLILAVVGLVVLGLLYATAVP
jgi:hypothetical protein